MLELCRALQLDAEFTPSVKLRPPATFQLRLYLYPPSRLDSTSDASPPFHRASEALAVALAVALALLPALTPVFLSRLELEP